MTVNYMKYKDGKRKYVSILFFLEKKKNTHKAEGSSKLLNMDTICY